MQDFSDNVGTWDAFFLFLQYTEVDEWTIFNFNAFF